MQKSLRLALRALLFVFAVILILFGLVALLNPQRLPNAIHLIPMANAGLSEMRGLYGGGFIGFGMVTILGLFSRRFGPGLLLAMAIIFGCIVVARLLSIVLDADISFILPAAIPEFIFAALCYVASRQVPK